MKQVWRRALIVLICCTLAVFGWIGLLRLADTISAARSYKDSPAELRAAADAAVLPAADPAFTGSGEYTDAEQAEAQAAYYASIGGDPLDTEPLEPIVDGFVSFIPGTLPAEMPVVSGASGESVQNFVVNTASGVLHLASCYHVRQMEYANRGSFTGTREEAVAMYTPCKDCNP